MIRPSAMTTAGIGLTVRAGRAVVVVLTGTRRAPAIVLRHEIDLGDPWLPESLHPYHRELGDPSPAAAAVRRRGCSAARRSTRRALRTFVRDMRSHGFHARDAGVVTPIVRDPARVAGAHARAHAAERALYVDAVLAALRACGVRAEILLDRTVRSTAVRRLRRPRRDVDASLRTFSHTVGTPWRAQEKAAVLAAWMSLPG
jgi:hypothetical protein